MGKGDLKNEQEDQVRINIGYKVEYKTQYSAFNQPIVQKQIKKAANCGGFFGFLAGSAASISTVTQVEAVKNLNSTAIQNSGDLLPQRLIESLEVIAAGVISTAIGYSLGYLLMSFYKHYEVAKIQEKYPHDVDVSCVRNHSYSTSNPPEAESHIRPRSLSAPL